MKLSEAIRLGSVCTEQIRGRMFNDSGGACALGGALVASDLLLVHKQSTSLEFWRTYFPIAVTVVDDPVEGHINSVCDIVIGLNDDKGWTRNQIADWVEGVEKQAEAEKSKILVASSPKVQ